VAIVGGEVMSFFPVALPVWETVLGVFVPVVPPVDDWAALDLFLPVVPPVGGKVMVLVLVTTSIIVVAPFAARSRVVSSSPPSPWRTMPSQSSAAAIDALALSALASLIFPSPASPMSPTLS
jgi:hypothetical protein